MSIIPPYLKPGDKVGIVCTARKITMEEIDFAINKLKSWKLESVIGRTIGQSLNQFAGDDLARARDFQKMIDDASIKAILFTRGGYGTVRILDKLDFGRLKRNPKWLIGFSDITFLHSDVHQLYDVETIDRKS